MTTPTPDRDLELEFLISIWSMRPQPGTPTGDAWVEGARWAWEHAKRTFVKEDRDLIDWLAERNDLVVAMQPSSGQWQVFSQLQARTGIFKGCNAQTLRECLRMAKEYDFPSDEGYRRMIADQAKDKNNGAKSST